MIRIDLTEEEKHLLLEILDNDLSDLRMEIADTDRLDYRNYLKRKKYVLIKILEHLNQVEVTKSLED